MKSGGKPSHSKVSLRCRRSLQRLDSGGQPRLGPRGGIAVNNLVGGSPIKLLGSNPQGALGVVGLAGLDGIDHFANAGLQFALHCAVPIPPLQTLTVALLCTTRMGHSFRYLRECCCSLASAPLSVCARGESNIVPESGELVQRGKSLGARKNRGKITLHRFHRPLGLPFPSPRVLPPRRPSFPLPPAFYAGGPRAWMYRDKYSPCWPGS